VILQTYLTAKNERKPRVRFGSTPVPETVESDLPAAGVIIFTYFRMHPEPAAQMRVPDDALAVYVLNVLPGGARGLAIAALMSALLTSLEGGMAALSACLQVDYLQRA